jgi:hypothetical protein
VHHERGPKIDAVSRTYDSVAHRTTLLHTVVTAVVANRERSDGLDVVVQDPLDLHAEEAYLHETATTSYAQMTAVRQRLWELLHHQLHRRSYRQRTELAIDIVRQWEAEGQFPQAHYAFDHGGLRVDLTRWIEQSGKHWVSERECARHINWRGQWRRIDHVATALRAPHPESFRPVTITCRNGQDKQYWGFTKVVRLKKSGEKRVVIVHEQEDLQDHPRCFVTDAKHWESKRILETWSYRWTSEVFLPGLMSSSSLWNISDFVGLRPGRGALECGRQLCLKRPSIRVGLRIPITRSYMRSWHLESAVVDSPFSRSVRNAHPVSSRAAHPSPVSQHNRLHG